MSRAFKEIDGELVYFCKTLSPCCVLRKTNRNAQLTRHWPLLIPPHLTSQEEGTPVVSRAQRAPRQHRLRLRAGGKLRELPISDSTNVRLKTAFDM